MSEYWIVECSACGQTLHIRKNRFTRYNDNDHPFIISPSWLCGECGAVCIVRNEEKRK